RQGQQETDRALGDLRAQTAGTGEAAATGQVESSARSWERWAEAMRGRVAATQAPVIDPSAIDEGRRLFSDFRAAQRDLVSGLDADSSGSVFAALLATWVKAVVVAAGSVVVGALLGVTA